MTTDPVPRKQESDVVGWRVAEGVSVHFANPHFMGCLACTPDYQRIAQNAVMRAESEDEGYVCDTCHRPLIGGEPQLDEVDDA